MFNFEANMSLKKAQRLPNFKGRACKLDFPALLESNFAAYLTGCQLFGPEKSVKVYLRGRKFGKKLILGPKVNLKSKSQFEVSFFQLKMN